MADENQKAELVQRKRRVQQYDEEKIAEPVQEKKEKTAPLNEKLFAWKRKIQQSNEEKPTDPVQEKEKKTAPLDGKWLVFALVSVVFIFYSRLAYGSLYRFIGDDLRIDQLFAYGINCVAVAAVACVALKKRLPVAALAIAYAVLNACILFINRFALWEFVTLILSIIPIFPLIIFHRNRRILMKVFMGIGISALVGRIVLGVIDPRASFYSIKYLQLSQYSQLCLGVAIHYFFWAIAAVIMDGNLVWFSWPQDEQKKPLGAKSKMVAAVLSFFLGAIGVHRYYLGYKKRGTLMTIGGCCLVPGVVLLTGGFAAAGSYRTYDLSSPLLVLSVPLLLVGAMTALMAFIDFVWLITGQLLPADGQPYQEDAPAQATLLNPTSMVEALDKLSQLHEQGILTDEEFQQKKMDFLRKM